MAKKILVRERSDLYMDMLRSMVEAVSLEPVVYDGTGIPDGVEGAVINWGTRWDCTEDPKMAKVTRDLCRKLSEEGIPFLITTMCPYVVPPEYKEMAESVYVKGGDQLFLPLLRETFL